MITKIFFASHPCAWLILGALIDIGKNYKDGGHMHQEYTNAQARKIAACFMNEGLFFLPMYCL